MSESRVAPALTTALTPPLAPLTPARHLFPKVKATLSEAQAIALQARLLLLLLLQPPGTQVWGARRLAPRGIAAGLAAEPVPASRIRYLCCCACCVL